MRTLVQYWDGSTRYISFFFSRTQNFNPKCSTDGVDAIGFEVVFFRRLKDWLELQGSITYNRHKGLVSNVEAKRCHDIVSENALVWAFARPSSCFHARRNIHIQTREKISLLYVKTFFNIIHNGCPLWKLLPHDDFGKLKNFSDFAWLWWLARIKFVVWVVKITLRQKIHHSVPCSSHPLGKPYWKFEDQHEAIHNKAIIKFILGLVLNYISRWNCFWITWFSSRDT